LKSLQMWYETAAPSTHTRSASTLHRSIDGAGSAWATHNMNWSAAAVTSEHQGLRSVEKVAVVRGALEKIVSCWLHECPRFENHEAWGSRFRGSACQSKSGPAPLAHIHASVHVVPRRRSCASTRPLPAPRLPLSALPRPASVLRSSALLCACFSTYTFPLSFAKIILSFVPKEGIRSTPMNRRKILFPHNLAPFNN